MNGEQKKVQSNILYLYILVIKTCINTWNDINFIRKFLTFSFIVCTLNFQGVREYLDTLIEEYNTYVDEDGSLREDMADKEAIDYKLAVNQYCFDYMITKNPHLSVYLQDDKELTEATENCMTDKNTDNSFKDEQKYLCHQQDNPDPASSEDNVRKCCTQMHSQTAECRVKQKCTMRQKCEKLLKWKIYSCGKCCKKFISPQTLDHHICNYSCKRSCRCDCCNRSFPGPSDLRRHTGIHSGRRPHKCNICKVTFVKKLSLSRHMHGHQKAMLQKGKPFKKHVMPSNTDTEDPNIDIEEQISRHYTQASSNRADYIHIHTEDSIFGFEESPVDRSINADSHQLCSLENDKWRVKTNQSDNPTQDSDQALNLKGTVSTQVAHKKLYKCQLCDRDCKTPSALRHHKRMHTGEKPYKCKVCEQSFTWPSNLTRHQRRHTGEKPYKCKVCKQSFAQSGLLTRHALRHTGEKPYKCKVCGQSFKQSQYLTNHVLIHTGEKPFKCSVCDKCFRQKSTLSTHMLLHTGEKPFKCFECEKCFHKKSHLTVHMRTHTGELPYKCTTCNESFKQVSHLTQHMRIHTGEKPYKCVTCNKCFSSSTSLRRHMQMHTVRSHTSVWNVAKMFPAQTRSDSYWRETIKVYNV